MYVTQYKTKNGVMYRAWERITVDGVAKKISVTMDRDTPQARKKAAAQLAKKMERPADGVTYGQLVKEYIEYQKAIYKMSTWARNEASLKRLESVFGSRKKIADMTSGYVSSRLLQKTKNPVTYNEYLKRVKAMFRWAYRNDYIESSACVDKLKPMKDDTISKVDEKYLESDELKKVLDAATPYYRAVFQFLALSGLRIGELVALDDSDVTETDIIVSKTYDSIHGIMNTTKTPSSWRHVHIQPELKKCIAEIRLISNQNRVLSGHRPPYFVVSMYGGRLSYPAANREFKALCARETGKDLSIHALRHSHVAYMAERGVTIDAIARRLGHSSSKVTMDIYYHCTKKQVQKDNAAFDAVSIFA